VNLDLCLLIYLLPYYGCINFLQFLQKEIPPRVAADQESLFVIVPQMKYNSKKMKKLEKEYAAMKTKEQEEMVELRV